MLWQDLKKRQMPWQKANQHLQQGLWPVPPKFGSLSFCPTIFDQKVSWMFLGHSGVVQRPAPSRHCLDSTWCWRAGTLQMYQRLMVVKMPLWQPPQCQPPSPTQRPQAPLIPIQPPSLPQPWQDVSLIFHDCWLFYDAVFIRVPFGSLPNTEVCAGDC